MATPEQNRELRRAVAAQAAPIYIQPPHNPHPDFNKGRTDGKPPIKGPKAPLPKSSFTTHQLLQQGARSEAMVHPRLRRFNGETAEDQAAGMHQRGERINRAGQIEPDDNVSSRIKGIRQAAAASATKTEPPATTGPSASNNSLFGLPPETKPEAPAITDPAAKGNTPVVGDPFGTGFKSLTPDNPFIPALAQHGLAPTPTISDLRQSIASSNNPNPSAPQRPLDAAGFPTDPTNVRQPAPPVSDGMGAKDAMGNPASTSNPVSGSPAEFRQMASDAAIGRTVNTSGTQGVDKFADTIPIQAADFRRSISSQYGTGSNVTRQPGQGPGMTTDLMGRPTTTRNMVADRQQIQATKSPKTKEEQQAIDEAEAKGEGDEDQRKI